MDTLFAILNYIIPIIHIRVLHLAGIGLVSFIIFLMFELKGEGGK